MNFKIKPLIFALLMLIATILFWWCLSLFFTTTSLPHLIYLVSSALILLIVFLLFSVLVESRNVVYLTFILSLGGFFLFFSPSEELTMGIYIIGLLLFLLVLVIGYGLMSREKDQRLKLSLKKIWKRGLPFAITGIALIVSLVYYFNPLLNLSQEKIEIPTQVFSFLLKPASGIVSKILPFYDPEMTIDETLASGLILQGEGPQLQVEDVPADLLEKIDFSNLENLDINELLKDPAVKDFLKEQVSQGDTADLVAEQRKQLSQSLGVELKGDETMEVVLANLVNSKLDEFVGPYAKEISLGITVALFLILKLVGKLFGLLAMILSRILFSILLLFKTVRIEEEMRPGEVIKW